MAAIKSVPAAKTPDAPYINGLLYGFKWGSPYVTVGFPTNKAQYGKNYPEAATLKPFTNGQIEAARDALQNFDDVSGLEFIDMGNGAAATGATVRYGGSDAPKTAHAHLPNTNARGGDVWLGNKNGYVADPLPGGYTYHTMLHETGHALGLMHPHERNMPKDHDSLEYTVMSHKSYAGQAPNPDFTVGSGSYPQTLMQDDLRALQHMYGADYSPNNTDTTYKWNPQTGELIVNGQGKGAPMANKVFMTIWDGGGSDTYDLSNYTEPLKINLQPGQWVTLSPTQLADLGSGKKPPGSVANAYLFNNNKASLIENAIGGSGNDTIVGNAANNRIDGRGGTDTVVYAGKKADYSITQTASDTWSVTGKDTGTDTLINVEKLVFDDGQIVLGVAPLDTA